MRRSLRGAVAVAALAYLAVPTNSALAEQRQLNAKVTTIYGPASASVSATRDALSNAKVLEKLQRFLSPLRLQDNIVVQTAECGPPTLGRHYSFVPYQRGKPVTICYEFVQLLAQLAPADASHYDLLSHALVTREMAIEGPFVQEVLHNVAYAVFDQLRIPIWGGLDNAADNVTALSMTYFGGDVALKSILGIGDFLTSADNAITKIKGPSGTPIGYDSTYLLDIRAPMLQRYYNVLCVAMGKDPVLFSPLIAFPPENPTSYQFSWSKAQDCKYVYAETADGFKRLIYDKYVDPKLLNEIKDVDWYASP